MTERTPMAARCKALRNFHRGNRMLGPSLGHELGRDGGVPWTS
jgi:hypothetical protein